MNIFTKKIILYGWVVSKVLKVLKMPQSRQSHWDRDPQGWKMKAIWNHHSPHAILRTGTYPSNFQGEPRVFALSKWQKPVGVSIVALNSLSLYTLRYFCTIFPHQPFSCCVKKKTCGFVLFCHGLDYLRNGWNWGTIMGPGNSLVFNPRIELSERLREKQVWRCLKIDTQKL